MKAALYNQSGEKIGSVTLPDGVFNLDVDEDAMHRAFMAQIGNARKVTAHVKDRSEVRGGGRKPWKQKGTGRARHGSIRSPIWKGGGATFGPTKERNFGLKINKKAKRKSLFTALSSKVKDEQYIVVDDLKFKDGKTKEAYGALNILVEKLKNYNKEKKKRDSVLIIFPSKNASSLKAIRNLSFAGAIGAKNLNIKDLLNYKHIILLKDSIAVIQDTYKLR